MGLAAAEVRLELNHGVATLPGEASPVGTVVRTLWGELAWQLGGRKEFQRLRADDEKATSPGDVLRELLNEHGPCLILIYEWVAYARQLHDAADLPAGSFETHCTFAQVLTESAKLAKQCLLVISLPASDTGASPHTQADDVEVGGERGRAALDRLRNVIGRLESSWRPASAEEGFEIVRRRFFEPLVEQAQFVARDTVARVFYDLYRTQHQEFPPECRDSDYEKRHPDLEVEIGGGESVGVERGMWPTWAKFRAPRHGALAHVGQTVEPLGAKPPGQAGRSQPRQDMPRDRIPEEARPAKRGPSRRSLSAAPVLARRR